MNDTTRLINELRLERDTLDPVAGLSSRKIITTLVVATVLLAGGFIYWTITGTPQGILIQVATVAAFTQDGANPDNAVLNASGYIVARRQATVSAKITARVTEVFIDEGQSVEQGEIIATLDNTNIKAVYQHNHAQLEQASASLRAAQVAVNNEQPLFARVQQQLERGVGSQQDFDVGKARYETARANLDVATQTLAVAEASLLIAERNLDDTIVRAPFSGIVTVKAAQPGEMVSPISAGGGFTRTGIGTIVDMASLEVDVDVSESFINR
ncbi:MAG: biotin/lipoyl-binding protein, partial [Pseudomonadota bacterium]